MFFCILYSLILSRITMPRNKMKESWIRQSGSFQLRGIFLRSFFLSFFFLAGPKAQFSVRRWDRRASIAPCGCARLSVYSPGVDFINFFCALRPCPNHRDSSIHLRPTPTPNFLRSFLLAQSWALRFALCIQLYEIDPWSLGGFVAFFILDRSLQTCA